jgi:hypothetical protein
MVLIPIKMRWFTVVKLCWVIETIKIWLAYDYLKNNMFVPLVVAGKIESLINHKLVI